MKVGPPTVDLMGAYRQVRDWIHEYKKHGSVVLEGLWLKKEEVMAVRDCAIAGQNESEKFEYLQRHITNPIYPDIDFITLAEV